MTSALSHPLVSAYLRDLELLLHGVEPGERAEVLAGVHEHLDTSLTPSASDEDVRRSLAELGSPQSVADEAYAGRSTPASASPAPARQRPGPLSRGWVAIIVGLGLSLALVLVILVAAISTGYSTPTDTESIGMFSSGTVQTDLAALPGTALTVLLVTVLAWFPPLFLCTVSPLWNALEKAAAGLTLPLAASVITALPALGWATTKTEFGITLGAWTSLALAVVGGGYMIVRTTRIAARRAESLEAGIRA